jgi:hypothetical protein
MNEPEHDVLERRARTLFHDSVENLDMRVRSRLTRARHAALAAAPVRGRSLLTRKGWWVPAAGLTAVAVLGVALWTGNKPLGTPWGSAVSTLLGHHAVSLPDAQSNLEDLDIVAASDGSGDAMEMLQDDLDFYDFADKAANPEPAA